MYFHGGGFVIANNSTYDASARMLAKEVGAVVIEPEYSKAPEHKFPASHDDAVAAYKWVTQNAASVGGDPKKIALAGESAGGNLAVNVAISARDQHLTMPVHELVVYPMCRHEPGHGVLQGHRQQRGEATEQADDGVVLRQPDEGPR